MAKRKNKDPGARSQLHPTRSFDQYVADATLAKLSGYIDSEIQQAAQAIMIRNQQAMSNILTRIVAQEDLAIEKLGVTKDDLASRVATVQDRFDGYEATAAEAAVEKGDRVRLEIKTRTADQTEFQGSSRLMLDNAGSGQTLGKELEESILGMKAGETKEVKFGKDQSLLASLLVNRISRLPKEEAAPQAAAPEAAAETPQAAEAPSASPNAG